MISGFSIVRNAIKLNYPLRECLESLHNVCDEVVLGVDPTTDDGTIELAREISSELGTRIFESPWDMSNIKEGLEIGIQTQKTLEQCNFEWTLYCQMDEAIHETDRERLHWLTQHAPDDVSGYSFVRPYFWRDLKTIRKDWSIEVNRLSRQGTHDYSTLDGHSSITKKGRLERSGLWMFHYSRFGTPEEIATRIRNIDEFFHPEENLVAWDKLEPYKFEAKKWDSYEVGANIPDANAEFVTYTGSHPAPFARRHSSKAKSTLKVELGSGPHGIPDFLHVDAVQVGNVDKVADIRNLDFLEDDSVLELYTAHALEHISYTEVDKVLKEWCRVLQPGGKITIKMPDLEFLCRALVEGIHSAEEVMIALYGGFSDTPGGPDGWEKISGDPNWKRNSIPDGHIPHPGVYIEWGAHKAMYTFNTIKPRMERAGFQKIQRVVENDWELHITAIK